MTELQWPPLTFDVPMLGLVHIQLYIIFTKFIGEACITGSTFEIVDMVTVNSDCSPLSIRKSNESFGDFKDNNHQKRYKRS